MKDTRLNRLRTLIMDSMQRESIQTISSVQINAGFNAIVKEVEVDDAQSFVFGMVTMGISRLRDVIARFWELQEMSVPAGVETLRRNSIDNIARGINLEIQRMMTLVVSAVSKGDLHPFNADEYAKFAVTTAEPQEKLSADIGLIMTELRALGSK